MAMLLKGVEVTRGIFAELKVRVAQLKQQGTEPCLAAVECGEEGDNGSYVRSMRKNCEKLGVRFEHIVLPQSCSEQELL
ncbi:MAG: bifunctional 5,10-methylene-tetrahydrofolate dehydrogenase/5,10-methylene-tetrahydrofolate cyclohydrolase, partial [Oscillospiraceae bacterium]|nr:bifunctional 5,10-methylene-tetrahydrofolate dehydrogenase/5,10-methylene-tetrahydrofolate cyclohydrolase [Oscillospiraceae bacterium]